ncbi:MAG TPA: glycosyltransferase family 9 protein [Opitutaceae bacterium]|nr:glycosyltransferase family 9 protein [Opitutaceae bacterium]
MHLVTFNEPVDFARGKKIAPGRYLADNVNAGQWLARHSRSVMVEPCPALPAWQVEARSVCIIRPGGLGDLIMITPILREVRRLHPDCVIHVCTHAWNAVVLQGLPFVDGIVPYPMEAWRLGDYEAVVPMEDLVESEPKPAEVHALDSFLKAWPGLTIENRRPEYHLPDSEREEVRKRCNKPSTRRFVVGVQLEASSPVRTYPRMTELLDMLIGRGHGVRIFGEPGKHQIKHPYGARLQNLPACTPAPNFRESVALAADCDGLIVADSSMVHAAGALGLTAVALYGSFPWQVRTKDYPTVHALNGIGPCAACCWHGRTSRWPGHGPCTKSGYCDVLATIEPGRIVTTLEKLMEAKQPHQ